MEVDHFHLQVDGAYHPPRGHEAHTVEWPHGTFDIDGSAQITSTQMHFRVDRLVSDSARSAARARRAPRGGLLVTPKAGPHGKVEIAFDNVAVTATSEGDEIARLSPMLHPRGRWQVHAEGGGPLSHLRARAIIDGPKGSVTVDGVLARGEILRWGGKRHRVGDRSGRPIGAAGHAARRGRDHRLPRCAPAARAAPASSSSMCFAPTAAACMSTRTGAPTSAGAATRGGARVGGIARRHRQGRREVAERRRARRAYRARRHFPGATLTGRGLVVRVCTASGCGCATTR